jgi:hypothetical protein
MNRAFKTRVILDFILLSAGPVKAKQNQNASGFSLSSEG